MLRNLPSDTGSAATIRRWIHTKQLPSVKVGKRRLVRRRDLAEFLGVDPSEIVG
ncbi:MAG: helix-turn-helix domain-containing protein [Sandaracinaceae bacterium]